MPAEPNPLNAAGRAGSTPAEGPQPPAPTPPTEKDVPPGPAEGLSIEERVARLEGNAPEGEPFSKDPTSIEGTRQARDDASGYSDLVAEVEALEAAVEPTATEKTAHSKPGAAGLPTGIWAEVVALRNKIERPPAKEPGSNSINSPEVRREQIDRLRAVAQDIATRIP